MIILFDYILKSNNESYKIVLQIKRLIFNINRVEFKTFIHLNYLLSKQLRTLKINLLTFS